MNCSRTRKFPQWLMHPFLVVKLNLGSLVAITLILRFLEVKSKTCISRSLAVAITSSFLLPSRVTSTVMAIRGLWKPKEAYLLPEILALLYQCSKQKRSLQTLTEKVSGKRKLWPLQNTVKWELHILSVTAILMINSWFMFLVTNGLEPRSSKPSAVHRNVRESPIRCGEKVASSSKRSGVPVQTMISFLLITELCLIS